MPFNGSGAYTAPGASFPAVSNTLIESAKFNAIINDIATALTTCVTKDGQTTITAPLPMAGYRHTGVGNAAARDNYATAGQIQDGSLNWVVAGGTADALTATYIPAVTALVDGQLCFVRAGSANATTTPTFAPNLLTAHTITKLGGVALVANEWATDQELILRYKLASTRWELLNPGKFAPSGSAGGDLTGTYPNPTIAANAVTNAKFAQMAANTLKGNNTGSTADPIDLTVTQVRTMLVGPYFQAHMSGNQSLTQNTLTKVSFDTEDFDSNTNYDNGTNYRFTPTVAGKYRIRAQIQCSGTYTTSAGITPYLKKNGSTYYAGAVVFGNGSQVPNTSFIEAMMSFNGSTDYVEAWILSSGTSPAVVASGQNGNSEINSLFSGEFVGP